MCNCNNNIKGDRESIALAFKTNRIPVMAVFAKYGMGKLQPTAENALVGVQAFGEPFAKEVSLASAGLNLSNYTAEEQQKQASLAATIFGILGTAADAGINIAKGVAEIKNGNTSQAVTQLPVGTTGTNGTSIVYLPNPSAAAPTTDQRILGFTMGQFMFLLAAGALVVGAVLYFKKGKG